MTPRHLCLLFITLCPFIFGRTNQESLPLEAGKSVERELTGDQSHAYTLTLAAGQYLRVVIEPRGIDVALKLFGPDGKLIAEVDTPFAGEEPEKVSLVLSLPMALSLLLWLWAYTKQDRLKLPLLNVPSCVRE